MPRVKPIAASQQEKLPFVPTAARFWWPMSNLRTKRQLAAHPPMTALNTSRFENRVAALGTFFFDQRQVMEYRTKRNWKSEFREGLKWHLKDFILMAAFVIGCAAVGAALGGAICAFFGLPLFIGIVAGAFVFELFSFSFWLLRRRR
ncbi:hypothetical protein D1823_11275 [Ruegeria sp. AD91A]|nr:hypothetical protein D1823_11275 [Ruegeria sp. AD91A]